MRQIKDKKRGALQKTKDSPSYTKLQREKPETDELPST
jgi:hypothetical protein